MAFNKITETDLVNKGVTGLADTPGLSATDMQKKFDELSKDVIIPKYNELVDKLNTDGVAEDSKATDPTDGSEKSIQEVIDNIKDYTDTEITATQTKATAQVGELKDYTDSELTDLDEKLSGAISTLDTKVDTDIATLTASTNKLVSDLRTEEDGKITAHTSRTDNPHNVTASQLGVYTSTQADEKLSLKVDKVSGKGLSTNDYTTADKSNVSANTTARHTHENKTLLDSLTSAILTTLQRVATMFASITGVTTSVVDSDEKIPTSGAIVDYVSSLGGGDMLKSTYDKNNNGKVDVAEKADSATNADNATKADNALKLNNHSDTYFAKATDVGTVAQLKTTTKTSVVAAINEIIDEGVGGAGIDDSTVALDTTWSSSKISGEFADVPKLSDTISTSPAIPRDADTLGGLYSAQDITDISSSLNNLENAKVIYNSETDKLDVYVDGVVVGGIDCGFKWDGTIYYNGNQYTANTGGIVSYPGTGWDTTVDKVTPTFNSGNIVIASTSGKYCAITTGKKIDLTNYTKLKFIVTASSSTSDTSNPQVAIQSDNSAWFQQNTVLLNSDQKSTGTKTIDISAISGSYYISLGNYNGRSTTITKIWLE